MKIDASNVGLVKTDKYVLMTITLLILFGMERITSGMEGINY